MRYLVRSSPRLEQPKTDLFEVALQDPSIRGRILARKRSKGDLNFEVPEFTPVLNDLSLRLEGLKNRISAAKNSDWQRALEFRLKAAALELKINALTRHKIRYWDVIEASVEFSLLADLVVNAETSKNTVIDIDLHVNTELKRYKDFAQDYPILLIPTFAGEIGEEKMATLFGQGIAPLGLVVEATHADGELMMPSRFLGHDLRHAAGLAVNLYFAIHDPSRHQDMSFNGVSGGLIEEQFRKIEIYLQKRSLLLKEFMARILLEPDANFRGSLFQWLSEMDHERSLIQRAFRPLDAKFFETYAYHFVYVRVNNGRTPRATYLRSVFDWALINWNQSLGALPP